MEKRFNKGWVDAVREQCLSDGAAPSPDGWAQIGRKMRRAAARRRAALAAAVALPAIGLLLWAPWRSTVPSPSPVVQVPPPVPVELVSSTDSSFVVPQSGQSRLAHGASSARMPIPPTLLTAPDTAGKRPEVPAQQAHQEPSEPTILPENPDIPSSKEVRVEDGKRPLLAFDNPTPRRRPRFSVSLDANTVPGGRHLSTSQTEQNMYYVVLNRLNQTYDEAIKATMISKSNPYSNNMIWRITWGRALDELEMDPTVKEWVQVERSQWQHDLPLSFAFTVKADLNSRWALETGVEYSYLHSWEKLEEYQEHRVEGPQEQVLIYNHDLDQRMHFVGIPLRVTCRAWSPGGWDFYVGAGIKGEKCVKAQLGTVEYVEPRLQWSAEAFGGVQYQVLPRTHLYFQPAMSWYFTKTDLITYRTENPVGLSLRAGFRFDL